MVAQIILGLVLAAELATRVEKVTLIPLCDGLP